MGQAAESLPLHPAKSFITLILPGIILSLPGSPVPKPAWTRFFNITLDARFIDIIPLKDPPILSEADRQRLLANVADLDVWLSLIPPDHFEFQGFGVFRAADVTEHEMLSALENDLFENEAIFQRDGFATLQEKLQIYLQEKELTLGLLALRGEQILILPHTHKLPEKSCILENADHLRISDFAGSIFFRALDQNESMVIEDLQSLEGPTPPGRAPASTRLPEYLCRSPAIPGQSPGRPGA